MRTGQSARCPGRAVWALGNAMGTSDDEDSIFLRKTRRPHPFLDAAPSRKSSKKRTSETTVGKSSRASNKTRPSRSRDADADRIIELLTSEGLGPSDDEDLVGGDVDEDGMRTYVTESQRERHSMANLLRVTREESGQSSSSGTVASGSRDGSKGKGKQQALVDSSSPRRRKSLGRRPRTVASEPSLDEDDDADITILPPVGPHHSSSRPSAKSSSPQNPKKRDAGTGAGRATSEATTTTLDAPVPGPRKTWTLAGRPRERPKTVSKPPSPVALRPDKAAQVEASDQEFLDEFDLPPEDAHTWLESAAEDEEDLEMPAPFAFDSLDFRIGAFGDDDYDEGFQDPTTEANLNGDDELVDYESRVLVPETQFAPTTTDGDEEDATIPDSADEVDQAFERPIDRARGINDRGALAKQAAIPDVVVEGLEQSDPTREAEGIVASTRPRGFRPAHDPAHLVPIPRSHSESSLSGHSAHSVEQRQLARRAPVNAAEEHVAPLAGNTDRSPFFASAAPRDYQPLAVASDDDDDDDVLIRRLPPVSRESTAKENVALALAQPQRPQARSGGQTDHRAVHLPRVQPTNKGLGKGKGRETALAEELFPEEEDEYDDEFELDEDTALAIERSMQDQQAPPSDDDIEIVETLRPSAALSRRGARSPKGKAADGDFVWPSPRTQMKTFGIVVKESDPRDGLMKPLSELDPEKRDFCTW